MRKIGALLFSVLFLATMARAQEVAEQVSAIASEPIQSHEDVISQLREYLMARAPQLPKPTSAAAWTAKAEQIEAFAERSDLPRLARRVGRRSSPV